MSQFPNIQFQYLDPGAKVRAIMDDLKPQLKVWVRARHMNEADAASIVDNAMRLFYEKINAPSVIDQGMDAVDRAFGSLSAYMGAFFEVDFYRLKDARKMKMPDIRMESPHLLVDALQSAAREFDRGLSGR